MLRLLGPSGRGAARDVRRRACRTRLLPGSEPCVHVFLSLVVAAETLPAARRN